MPQIALNNVLKGRIHSYETFGAVDGPGVRFIVFLHGCGFRCKYCHNPDTWARAVYTEASAAEVWEKAARYKSYWGENGGITISGGEPMLQAPFVTELFTLAHEHGVSTCLDTAAGPFDESNAAICELLAATDTVLLDIKHMDSAMHQKLTGADNESVKNCARYLAAQKKRVWIRHVLVPGWTDDAKHLRELGNFIRTLPNVERVDILPYHTLGVSKWRALNLNYELGDVPVPTPDDVARAKQEINYV